MFSEKNLPKLIIITPIITIVAFAALMIYFAITSQYDNFAEEIKQVEKEYLLRQKELLKNENNNVHDYIQFQRELFIKRRQEQLRQHVVSLENQGREAFKKSSSINGRFVFWLDASHQSMRGFFVSLLPKEQTLFKEALVVALGEKMTGFGEINITSLPLPRAQIDFYVKKDPNDGSLYGAISFRYDEEQLLKQEVIEWMERVRYGTHGYIWVHDTSHHLVAHPFRKESIGQDDTNNTDATGTLIFQQYVQVAQAHKEGDFVEYYWARPDFGEPAKKIGFLKLDPLWQWVIGTGLYVDDIEATIARKKKQLEVKIDRYVQIIIFTAFLLTTFFGVISFLLSKTTAEVFMDYRGKVSKKEHSLKELNRTLASRIQAAILEAKKKDQALLHQSRLAQMGEMISMIAHQWRQPLSEISGIFMEMKTAAKFGKVDREYIDRESDDGDRLIHYMSKTIDDFRDFFKPAKTKENFLVEKACEEAIILSDATLKSNHIDLTLHVEESVAISGYPSEYAQVVLNLILNAKDVLVERGVPHPAILMCVDVRDGMSVVVVKDNAGGVDETIKERVFEPYFSTKKGTGTGLGLYMSKMIIEENMGGELSVHNDEEGAVFTIKVAYER